MEDVDGEYYEFGHIALVRGMVMREKMERAELIAFSSTRTFAIDGKTPTGDDGPGSLGRRFWQRAL